MANETVLDRNKINTVVDPGDFTKTIILLGLAGYKMIVTNSVLRASLVIQHFLFFTWLVFLCFSGLVIE